jgi:hypothetical protein
MDRHESPMLSYPLMAAMFLLSIIVPMTLVGIALGMASSPWYWLLVSLIALGTQISLIIAYRSNAAGDRRIRRDRPE